jgi:hypothetical protein
MTDDEREVRDQVEEDREEDLELEGEQSGGVRGGDTIKVMGNTKWGDIELKRGIDTDKK